MTRPRTRPSVDDVLLHVAYAWAERSTCSYSHVGAVVAREGRILTTGYNGAPAGMRHCEHPPRLEGHPVVPCTNAVHAEANAVAWAARHGVSLLGSTLVTTLTPCVACAQLIIQAGVARVLAGEPYRDPAGWDLLDRAGIYRKVMEA